MKKYLLFLIACWALVFSACVKTEIIPETVEPKLRVEPAQTTLIEGKTLQLIGVYTDDQGKDQSSLIQWRSLSPTIAEVSGSGLVKAVSRGQVWIVATVNNVSASDSTLVTVVQDLSKPAQVSIQGPASGNLLINANLQLQAQVLDGNNQIVTNQAISWRSSAPAVATVSAAGLVTALSEGTAQITASSAGLNSLPFTIVVAPAGGTARKGTFSGNSGYSVKGTATLEQIGAKLKLSFADDFQASNGPMLGVYLAKTASGGLNTQNSVKINDLKSNAGKQEYDVPAEVALNDYDYVVIYCIPFNVRFGSAQLK